MLDNSKSNIKNYNRMLRNIFVGLLVLFSVNIYGQGKVGQINFPDASTAGTTIITDANDKAIAVNWVGECVGDDLVITYRSVVTNAVIHTKTITDACLDTQLTATEVNAMIPQHFASTVTPRVDGYYQHTDGYGTTQPFGYNIIEQGDSICIFNAQGIKRSCILKPSVECDLVALGAPSYFWQSMDTLFSVSATCEIDTAYLCCDENTSVTSNFEIVQYNTDANGDTISVDVRDSDGQLVSSVNFPKEVDCDTDHLVLFRSTTNDGTTTSSSAQIGCDTDFYWDDNNHKFHAAQGGSEGQNSANFGGNNFVNRWAIASGLNMNFPLMDFGSVSGANSSGNTQRSWIRTVSSTLPDGFYNDISGESLTLNGTMNTSEIQGRLISTSGIINDSRIKGRNLTANNLSDAFIDGLNINVSNINQGAFIGRGLTAVGGGTLDNVYMIGYDQAHRDSVRSVFMMGYGNQINGLGTDKLGVLALSASSEFNADRVFSHSWNGVQNTGFSWMIGHEPWTYTTGDRTQYLLDDILWYLGNGSGGATGGKHNAISVRKDGRTSIRNRTQKLGTTDADFLPEITLELHGTDGVLVPVGTTVERPTTPTQGTIRFNISTGKFEGFTGTVWVDFH